MSVNRTSLGKRISFYRSKSNLTQEVLAAKINCSREHIVRIENGTKIPSLSVLVKIANTLSVSADDVLNGYFQSTYIVSDLHSTVVTIVDGDEANAQQWEDPLHIIACFDVVTGKPGKVLYDAHSVPEVSCWGGSCDFQGAM